jgi:membrane-bound lytic murein transglycosylase D
MMFLKFSFIGLLMTIFITASDPYFGTDLTWRPIPPIEESDVIERSWMSTEAFKPYIMDHDDRVSDLFKVTPFFYPNVNFWFLIYTQFESNTAIIHDISDLSLIYKVLDFSSLHEKKLPKNTLYVLQQKLTEEKVDQLKKELEALSMDPYSLSPSAKRIYRTLQQAKVTLPISKSDRSIFFTALKKNIRTQTGQKNFIRDGVIRSLPYQRFLTKYFTDRKLPKELLAIPFLESSFNPKAQSKVNALGAWQFMPLIATYFIPKARDTDYRSNIGVASLAAAFLMTENFFLMKSWDLAVTAYNSGTKHLLKTKRELGRKYVDLETVIKHSDSRHFGFASKNFYSEFLALAHTLAYREDIFNELHTHDRSDVDEELKFYMAKCLMRLHRELSDRLIDDIHFHNHQIIDLQNQIPKGYILTTKAALNPKKFYGIAYKDLLKLKPKDWGKLLKSQSCSTR